MIKHVENVWIPKVNINREMTEILTTIEEEDVESVNETGYAKDSKDS